MSARMYQGRALRSPWLFRSASHAGAALVIAAALVLAALLSLGLLVCCMADMLSRLPR